MAAPNAASRVNRWLPPRPVMRPGKKLRARMKTRTPRRAIALGEVGGDRLAAVPEADGLLAQPGLEADKDDGHDPPPEQRAPVAMVAPGQDRQAQDQDPEDRRHVPVDPLEPGLDVAEGRDHLALAQRPVGAAQAGVGGADDHADRDEEQGGRDRDRGELLKPGHRASAVWAIGDRIRGATNEAMSVERAHSSRSAARIAAAGYDRPDAPLPRAGSRDPRRRLRLVDRPAAPSTLVVGGSGGPTIVPVIASSETVVGPDRILLGLLDATGTTPVGSPQYEVQIGYINVDKDPKTFVIAPAPATFVWAIPNQRAVWVQDATFNVAGNWAAVVTVTPPGQPAEIDRAEPAGDRDRPCHPGRREGPSTPTPTSASAGGVLASITTDPSPDPAFYEISEDQALAQHKPFVLVFATPAFCTSRVCGPTLDAVKAVAQTEPGMTFIQVEPYIMNYANGTLQPVLGAGQYPPAQCRGHDRLGNPD